MDKLISKIITSAEKITKFRVNVNKTARDKRTEAFLQARIQLLESYWMHFMQLHDELCEVVTPEEKQKEKIFSEDLYSAVECAFTEVMAWLKESLPPIHTPHGASMLNTTTNSAQHDSIKLPKINLPSFSGSYLEWPSFHDTYLSLIHLNATLSDVQKMHYLKATVTGDAAKLLKHLSITNSNYESAWQTLLDRYNNERLLVTTNIHALITLHAMTSESAIELRRVLDGFTQAVRSLQNLGRPVVTWDDWLVYFLTMKLDSTTRKDWETSLSSSTKLPSFQSLQTFLESRLHALSALKGSDKLSFRKPVAQYQSKPVVRTHYVTRSNSCDICQKKHLVLFCPQFRNGSIEQRVDLLHKKRLCTNCLRSGHHVSSCPSENRCKQCNQKHHTMIHQMPLVPSNQHSTLVGNSHSTGPTTSHLASNSTSAILLATAVVFVQAGNGRVIKARALLDQGSESNFITTSLVQMLRLPTQPANISVLGVGQCEAGIAKASGSHDVISTLNPNCRYSVQSLVLPHLTQLIPSHPVRRQDWPHLSGLQLADPDFENPAQIDLILGAEFYSTILLEGVKHGSVGAPVAQATSLGWIVSGAANGSSVQKISTRSLHTSSGELNTLLRKFWEIEEPPKASLLTPAEKECENYYRQTLSRTNDGRYMVKLPLKATDMSLGDSRRAALNALLRMEQRFVKNPELERLYSEFMQDYLQLRHMEIVQNEEQNSDRCFYLPHHAVLKPSSTTTKLRVVFNGSQKTSSGVSLNELLHTGPKLQLDVFLVLLKWRFYPYVYAADVAKMYRQIVVHKSDTDLQRILWRFRTSDPVQCYRLQTVTYGTTSAPYLACRTLLQLAEDHRSDFPDAARILEENTYVDDVLFGAFDEFSACSLRDQLNSLMQKGGFQLRKWLSNSVDLLQHIPEVYRENLSAVRVFSDSQVKALGISWCPTTDTLQCHIALTDPDCATKRSVLADISRLYDPLGWLSPVTISAKLLLQKLWMLKLDWDDQLPLDFHNSWLAYKQSLKFLTTLNINRWIGVTQKQIGLELHGFCDASLSAYGAVVYLRIIHDHDTIQTSLLAAKTRVSPIKTVSLPRLELCGASLLAELMAYIQSNLKLDTVPVHLWSDSTIVLAWLRDHPAKWKVFVANRVAQIHDKLPTARWHHISTRDNPADCITRGIPATELSTFALWWSGPQWLQQPSTYWPSNTTSPSEEQIQTEMRITCNTTTVEDEPTIDLIHRYSNLSKLLRVTAYCYRFYHNCKLAHTSRQSGLLTPDEIHAALIHLIQLTQRVDFRNELSSIKAAKGLPTHSTLHNLKPFLDDQQLLRVGGRLKNALLLYDEKYPIILSKNSQLTYLIIQHSHAKTLHGGVQATLQHIRARYWIVHGRSKVRQILRSCVVCCRFRAQTNSQLMGDLPLDRVLPSKPFLHSGVDYAGPFLLKPIKGRSRMVVKSYICLFICFSTRAIHLEVVMDLSADAFIAAFRRFISRRGRCCRLYSDNGRNFVASDKELVRHIKQISHDSHLANTLATEGTDWRFIPPASPHFGGYWEAGVKAFKYHFRRIVGTHTLSVEEMLTLSTQVEACLNSRPLHALSDDPDDFSVLTPGHFLVGESLLTLPTPSMLDIPVNQLTRWEMIQSMLEQLWHRWHKEYLHKLQLRTKWQRPLQPVQVNDLVLIKEENLPPAKWSLGRVAELHPGTDGQVRVATVRHQHGYKKRAITKLCLLPVEHSST